MILEVDNLSSSYGLKKVLFNISLFVEEKEIVAVIGPNGAGKTTTLKAIFGTHRQREGKVVFDDVVSKLKTDKKKLITIKFYKKIDFDKLLKIKDVRLLRVVSEYSVQVEADTSTGSLDEIIKKLRMGKQVEDLEVENPPITDLIKKLYKSRKAVKAY